MHKTPMQTAPPHCIAVQPEPLGHHLLSDTLSLHGHRLAERDLALLAQLVRRLLSELGEPLVLHVVPESRAAVPLPRLPGAFPSILTIFSANT